ncbi:hypothetical protein EV697_102401 [Bisgaardia hudsonensis]|uniref:Uncharacterized protein n=1 Tax=Bisgaardia hudsonensis TaxID=109472 RepID=A0A4R2N1Q8_9PAST|nr:hypothetical protein [Bisgaardia hudsonensis]QLB12925.1 hypothetical protein A6A11_04540 [Bisgaardia hudsonensis]TCP13515.1 hypothetical protein EV697_102401 [Bisgaardia hudsonensis]
MTRKSFETFYYLKDQSVHNVQIIQNEYKNKNGNILLYKGYIRCPECKTAELSFTHKTSLRKAFLSKLPTSEHAEGCSYIHNYASNKKLKDFVGNMNNEKIRERLESALNRLYRSQDTLSLNNQNNNEKNPFILRTNTSTKIMHNCIPRKSLNGWLDREDEGNVYIFYGEVKLKVEEIIRRNSTVSEKPIYKLIIRTYRKKEDQWIDKTNIYRNTIKDDIDENAIYQIAIFGHIEFYKEYPQIKSENLYSIFFREKA